MKIMSFDIGIKNMAYCIFDISPNKEFNIVDWNILNLMDKPTSEIKKCNCVLEEKNKKKNKLLRTIIQHLLYVIKRQNSL